MDEIRFSCPVAAKCGICQLHAQPYARQLEMKRAWVQELLAPYCRVQSIIGMENPLHYRNKTHAVFAPDRKGGVVSGVYQRGTHRVLPVEQCLIENEKADEIILTIKKLCRSFKIRAYDEDRRQGLLRHVLVRTGHVSGQIMVVLVVSQPVLPRKSDFVNALRSEHPQITTIVLNVNDRPTSMVLGKRDLPVYGKGYIEDTLCGKIFRISPQSFYQVNAVQTEKLYNKAVEFASLTGNETVFDAYCGIGTIGLTCAGHCKEVLGVELNPAAVKDAIENCRRNNVTNARFFCDDAGRFLARMAQEKKQVDVLMMDPPRSGSDETFLNTVCALRPQRVVYISCNPETLARDLATLTKGGYRAKKAVAVDMFPNTEHVETVVLMSRVEK